MPETPGPVQNAVGISTEAVYALSIKNPKAGGALLGEGKAHLPKRLQAEFQGRRFEGDTAAPLDHEGVEFLLTGMKAGVEEVAPGALKAEDESERSSDLLKLLGPRKERAATRAVDRRRMGLSKEEGKAFP